MNTVTLETIDELLNSASIKEVIFWDKCLVSAYQFPSGFIICVDSACVDPCNFDIELGRELNKKKVISKLWELEGYVLQKKLAE